MFKKLIFILLFLAQVQADTILIDPIFKPPQFTTLTRPICSSTFGCFGYNRDTSQFEYFDGIAWKVMGSGSSTAPDPNIIHQMFDSLGPFHIKLSEGPNRIATDTAYTIPQNICPNGEIFKSDGTNIICSPDVNTQIIVEDVLDSVITTNALSANQGRILNDKTIQNATAIATNTIDIATNASNIAVNAINIANNAAAIATNTINIADNTAAISTNTTDIAANADAITALDLRIDPLEADTHTHANKVLLDSLISNGTGDNFLSDDGTYKIPGGGNFVSGPASSVTDTIPRFADDTGKLLKGSGIVISDTDDLSEIQEITIKGKNSNNILAPVSAVNLGIGRTSSFTLNAGQTSADISIERGSSGGGYRHFISSMHSGSTDSNNQLRFYLNTGNSTGLSTAPGVSNSISLTMTPVGVGILKINPTQALDIFGNTTMTGSLTINDDGTNSSIFPLTRGTNGQVLKTDGAGTLSWVPGGSYANWVASHDYVVGETVVSPTNSNDIFRAKLDHTSTTNFIADRLADNWELISPSHYVEFVQGKQFFTGDLIRNPADGSTYRAKNNFIGSPLFITDLSNNLMDFVSPDDLTTSPTSGGVITFVAPNYQITAGTGYIRTNNGIIPKKWNATNIDESTLPNPNGYNTVIVNNAGTVTIASGMDSSIMGKQNIVLGNISGIDRKIIQRRGTSIDHGNTNRNLSHALGIIKNGLRFRGNAGTQTFLTEAGNINFDGINPTGEIKDLLDCSPQATTVFRLYDQDSDLGLVSIIPNSNYDVAGALQPIGGTNWGYFKIAVSLDCSISLQYGQDIKPTKNEIVAAEEENRDLYVVNPALKEAVLYSAIVFFVNGNIDFGNLTTTVWKNSGKLGIGSPGSGGSPSTGDVLGPASSNDRAIAVFAGGSGKTIQGSGVAISAANDITGAKDLTITGALKINDDSTNGYIFPLTRGSANQLLQTDGLGGLAWVTPAVQSGGDVVGPASSLIGNIAYFTDATGKTLGDSMLNQKNVNRLIFVETSSFTVPNLVGVCSVGSPGANPFPLTGNANGIQHSNGCQQSPFYTPTIGPRGEAFYAQNTDATGAIILNIARTNLNEDLNLVAGTTHAFISDGTTWNYEGPLTGAQWGDLITRKLITQFNNYNAAVKGLNYNNPSVPTAAWTFMVGRQSSGAGAGNLNPDQVAGDVAFEYGASNGGYKHYISSQHSGSVNLNNLSFWINNSSATTGSTTPGTGNTLALSMTGTGTGIGNKAPYQELDVLGNIVTSFHANSSQHNAAEVGSRRIGHISGNNADFAGMQINVSGTDSDGAARANSSNVAFYTWGNSISASREVAKITEKGNLNILGTFTQSIPYSLFHKAGITGGGNLNSVGGTISWTARFITIGLGKNSAIPSGYFDITMPPNGTIVRGEGGHANVTVTNGKISLSNWESLWYELPIGSNFNVVNTNFRISYFANGSFFPPPHWVLIAHKNGDANTVTWANGSVTPGYGPDVNYAGNGISDWVGIPSTNAAIRASGVSVRFENFGATVRLRGVITPTNNSDGGMGAAAIFGNIPVGYRPTGGYFNNGEPAHVFQINVSSFNNIGPPANGFVNSATGDISFTNMSGFESKFDTTWSL